MRRWCRGIHKSHGQTLQRFRALWLRCMCSAVIVSVQPVQHVDYWLEMQKHVEYVSCKSRAFAGANASMRWHSWAIRKQANIESSHLIVTSTKVAARYDTGSNQQPTSAQPTANGLLMDGCVPWSLVEIPGRSISLVDWNFWHLTMPSSAVDAFVYVWEMLDQHWAKTMLARACVRNVNSLILNLLKLILSHMLWPRTSMSICSNRLGSQP